MKKQTIKEVKAWLSTIEDSKHPDLIELRLDERKGVQTAIRAWEKEQAKKAQLITDYKRMSTFEESAKQKGYQFIAGVDEVGRGPLAGPVVAAAVILPDHVQLLGLNDSKQLSLKKREELYTQIYAEAIAVGVGTIEAPEIDRVNIYQASKLAMQQAINQLEMAPDYLLIDAMELDTSLPQEKIIKGDARSVSIAAASIIAKVTRDRLMEKYGEEFPGYGFERNAGYGTKEHLEGLKNSGVTPIHRTSFAPVKKCLSQN